MRSYLLWTICLLLPALAGAQSVATLKFNSWGFPVVPVFINGSGPYSLILDTGSNRTLVQNDILETLKISSNTLVPANMTTGVTYLHQVVAESVAVAGLHVNNLEIEGIDADQMSRMGDSIQGVLGEDFLKHFDLLIDNHAKTLTLDASSALARSLSGDLLPLSFIGMRYDQPTVDRLVLSLKLPNESKFMHFLIDSGSNYAMLYASKPLPYQGRATPAGNLQTLHGNSRCRIDFVTIKIGSDTLPRLGLASCEGLRDKVDIDGTLPTNIFDRLFISHKGAYAIANPRLMRK